MDGQFLTSIRDALKQRTSWERKLSDYYRLRYTGIPRAKKPYPGAPDMHYPLVDSVIEKMKPFFAQQLYGDSVLATFIAKDSGMDRGQVAQVERWFDYQLKQRSEVEKHLLRVVDLMLTYSFAGIKVYWDSAAKRLAYAAVDPFYMIVPTWTDEDNPDWFVHVMLLSKQQYKSNSNFNQDEAFVSRITGRGSPEISDTRQQDMAQREGITYSANDNQIVVWECYSKENDGKWKVETVSPLLGAQDDPIRQPFGMPFKHGEIPFCFFRAESGQMGWYSSRGVAEVLGDHELALCKSWNSKLQFLDFAGHPTYKNSNLSPVNTQNFSPGPGRVLPPGIEPNATGQAPLDFDKEMQFVRALAEDRISVPDLSSGEHLTARPTTKNNTTATQVNAIMALTNQSNDLRSRSFRLQLTKLYRQSYSLLNQYAGEELSYIFDNQSQQLNGSLLETSYDIQPSGSADSWNKQARQSKALAYYQTFSQNPFINLGELTKWVFEQDDPRVIERLIQDPQEQQQDQSEEQAEELLLMELGGYPAQIHKADIHPAHLGTIAQWMEKKRSDGTPITPQTAALVLQHSEGHMGAIQQRKGDKQGKSAIKAFMPYANVLQQIIAHSATGAPGGMIDDSGMPAATAPGGAPGPQQAPAPQHGASGQQQTKESIAINYKDAPPSIQRQMESAAGFQPASDQERIVDRASKKPAPKPAPAKIPIA